MKKPVSIIQNGNGGIPQEETRFSKTDVATIDDWAKATGTTRAEAIGRLLELGLIDNKK